ncbi:uncharacterized protein LOC129777946 [Toxorhynchites rutilus septentrionalis]|uniref:uncharacterized protein LOC129777946 n=1 Tax=Toxorhynchites rutilus septentrionalis TaxID=329112 RepID=UPI00247A9BE5|nr:uncharacterized protein LOC129777946 [Toxorhynchites rutilus septentrionalis]
MPENVPSETGSGTIVKIDSKSSVKSSLIDNEVWTYSFIILIKSLELANVGEDDLRPLSIKMKFGDSVINISSTFAEIVKQRRGNEVCTPCNNAEEFKQHLTANQLEVAIDMDGIELGKTSILLADTNLTSFDPQAFEPIIVSKRFPLEDRASSAGTIHLVLKADRRRSSKEPELPNLEDNSILYIVNESPKRRSSEIQEDTMRQLLTCKKCNTLRSPSEVSYQYELIDGILANREYTKKNPDLETMKRKVEQIEREAKLYPVGKEPEAIAETSKPKFCSSCGGYSVTGASCANWDETKIQAGTALLFDEDFICTNGGINRAYRSRQMPLNSTRIPEPSFGYSEETDRFERTQLKDFPMDSYKLQEPNYLCPKSAGIRFCQRCGLNMDWLPVHSSCPKCGYKCIPVRPESSIPAMHETAPNQLHSWLGSLEQQKSPHKRSSAEIGRTTSTESRPCPICRLRGGRCPDCQKRSGTVKQDGLELISMTLTSTSDSAMLRRKEIPRPKTRQSQRDRFRGFPKKVDKATRVTELQKIYGEEVTPGPTRYSRRSTRSSVTSTNVEEILKTTDAQRGKTDSGGVEIIKPAKIEKNLPKPADLESGCLSLTAAQIRKNQRKLLRHIKKQNAGKYSYQYGNRYPGIVAGHRECIIPGKPVPPHMGWLWNTITLGIGKIRRGWRPGAVRQPIKELMQHFLVSYPLDNIPVSRKAARRLKIAGSESQSLKPKPTLQIVKRDGEYSVVMNPLKDSNALKTTQDPYLACEPIRFKLAKDPHTGKLHQLRKALKVKGFTMCGCTELDSCDHKSKKEKSLMQKQIRVLSRRLGLPKKTGLEDIPVDSESELDLEFTPPSAMLKSGVRKPDVVCTETQYMEEDFKVQIPADKLKCKPGPREDPRGIGKAARVKLGRGMDKMDAKDGKMGKPTGVGGAKGARGAAGAKGGAGPKGGASGKVGAGGKGGDGAKGDDGTKGAKGGKSGDKSGLRSGAAGAGNRPQRMHRPDGGQVIRGETCKPVRCEPNPNYCSNVATGWDCQTANICYAPCAPAGPCYNPCYTTCI